MRRRDDDVEDLEHRIRKVKGAVLEDVDLDPLQQGHAVQLLLYLRHLSRLRNQALRVESMDDCDARRVVGDAQVPVAQGLRALRHLEHGGATVAPLGVRVDVAHVVLEVKA